MLYPFILLIIDNFLLFDYPILHLLQVILQSWVCQEIVIHTTKPIRTLYSVKAKIGCRASIILPVNIVNKESRDTQ